MFNMTNHHDRKNVKDRLNCDWKRQVSLIADLDSDSSENRLHHVQKTVFKLHLLLKMNKEKMVKIVQSCSSRISGDFLLEFLRRGRNDTVWGSCRERFWFLPSQNASQRNYVGPFQTACKRKNSNWLYFQDSICQQQE